MGNCFFLIKILGFLFGFSFFLFEVEREREREEQTYEIKKWIDLSDAE